MLNATRALWNILSKGYRDRNLKFDVHNNIETNMDEGYQGKLRPPKNQFNRKLKKIGEKSKMDLLQFQETIYGSDTTWKFLVENNIRKISRGTIGEVLNFPADGYGRTTIILI